MKLKFTTQIFLLFTFMLFDAKTTLAQDEILTEEYKEQVIQRLSQLMNDFYVFPEIAKETESHLKRQFKEGHFKQFVTNETLAAALTTAVQSINKDKHMQIRANPPFKAPVNTPERMFEERLDQINRSRARNKGFNTVKVLEGNVGYLDLRSFAPVEMGKEMADAYMKLISNTDAVIIDLSKNGGGSPHMVQYLCSYFFDQKIHLNSLYYRQGEETQEFWTLDQVGGDKMADVPLFVITSSKTFSGAEEFSYNMQTQGRATLVGQTSGGGANPGGTRGINEHLSVFIPTGKAINPITGTNWEGTGVIPDAETAEDMSLDRAHDMAKKAAEEYRTRKRSEFSMLFNDLNNHLDNPVKNGTPDAIRQSLTACQKAGFLNEQDINMLGYDYLLGQQKPQIAESIFKANTMIHPHSANVFDSYAEALMMAGDMKLAIENFSKAVELAVKNGDDNIELFQKNLENAQSKVIEKK